MFYLFRRNLCVSKMVSQPDAADNLDLCRMRSRLVLGGLGREEKSQSVYRATYGETGGRGPDTRPFDIKYSSFIDLARADQTMSMFSEESGILGAVGAQIARTLYRHMLAAQDQSASVQMQSRQPITHLATT